MNRSVLLAAVVLAVPAGADAQDAAKLDTPVQQFSYAMGYRMARDLLQQGIQTLDAQALAVGVDEAMAGKGFRFTQDDMRAIMTAYQQQLTAERADKAEANGAEGRAFLTENAKKDGVQSLESGVQYKVLNAGDGAKPAASDKVRVHYVGTLLDGTEFDSSRKRGAPTELALADVIPGWQSTLQNMPVGARWMVWIPPEQAYGMRGAGAVIGPNQTLAFDIELVEIVKPE